MAIEFGSRKETFDNFKVYETMLAGRPFKVEMGKMCGLSNASALIRYGETCVMCNVVMSPKPREGVDFFPLNVEYEEKLYAAGRIPGSFMRREGRPGERAILTSRVVDRPMRPLFPKEMRNDVCITMTVMSLDPDCSPEIAGMIGASLVTAVSEIPWNGPIGGVQVGLVDGEIVLNPTQEQRKVSDLALTVAATMDKIVMIEAGANEVDEDTMLNAIKAAHVEIKKIITFINGIVAERGKPKIDFQVVGLDMDVFHAIQNKYLDDFKAAMDTDDKNVRDAALLPIMDKIAEEYPDLSDADLDLVSYKMQKYVVRRWLLDEGKRVDGRGINEIRPLAAEVGILPRVHGSGMFTRGQTQVLTTCTLGGTKDNQLMDKDGNEVAGNGLYSYFDKDGKYKGGLYRYKTGEEQNIKNLEAVTSAQVDAFVGKTEKETGALTLTLHVGADATKNNQISVEIDAMSASSLGVEGLKVTGKDDTNALDAIETIKAALQQVSEQRSSLGAVQNRLEHTIKNLDNVVENTTSAESTIRDTDMATEMVKYSNSNILAQAGQSMLAQSNQSNQGVLSLLG